MHRCTNSDSAGSGITKYSGPAPVYRDESPGSYDATQLRHLEMNAIQEEICNFIQSVGISLNADTEALTDMDQMETAIKTYFGRYNRLRINGLMVTTPSGGDTVRVRTGSCLSADGAELIRLTGPRTKNLRDAASSGGMRPAAVTLAADTWYPIFVIKDTQGGQSDTTGLDTDFQASNLMSDLGYDKYRQVGWIYTYNDSGTIRVRSVSLLGDRRYIFDIDGSPNSFPSATLSNITDAGKHDITIPVPTNSVATTAVRVAIRVLITQNGSTAQVISIGNGYGSGSTRQDGWLIDLPAGGTARYNGYVDCVNGNQPTVIADTSDDYTVECEMLGFQDLVGGDGLPLSM